MVGRDVGVEMDVVGEAGASVGCGVSVGVAGMGVLVRVADNVGVGLGFANVGVDDGLARHGLSFLST